MLNITYDGRKAAANFDKHGVRFDEARGPLLRPKEPSMKKSEIATPPASKIVRGKYANLLKQGSNIVLLDADLLESFPDSPSVNRALRAFLAMYKPVASGSLATRARRRPPESASADFDPRVGVRAKAAR
jgi:hypothetical protein